MSDEPKARAVKLVSINPEDAGPVPEVVEVLEQALAMAKAGEVIGVAIATVNTRRCTATTFELGLAGVAELHFASAWLTQRLLTHDPDDEG